MTETALTPGAMLIPATSALRPLAVSIQAGACKALDGCRRMRRQGGRNGGDNGGCDQDPRGAHGAPP
jgi:hypothetical protein